MADTASEKKIDPQLEWHKARTAEERKAVVLKFPQLRHVFSAALNVFNHLSEDEKAAAMKTEAETSETE